MSFINKIPSLKYIDSAHVTKPRHNNKQYNGRSFFLLLQTIIFSNNSKGNRMYIKNDLELNQNHVHETYCGLLL